MPSTCLRTPHLRAGDLDDRAVVLSGGARRGVVRGVLVPGVLVRGVVLPGDVVVGGDVR